VGIIHARPFDDPRNTVIVDNNDPNAHDRRFVGMLGTHPEQWCCDNKPPSRLPEMTGWYLNSRGERICKIIDYWNRPENRAGARYGWWNAETPPGFYIEEAHTGTLMCDGCFGSAWDRFLDDLSTTFDQLIPVIRGIAFAVSYIPGLGTGVSFLLNAAVSLAQGASVEDAVLDGVGGALPGQPASGAAFNASRALIRGDRVDQAAIAALPVDRSVREVISAAMDIAVAISEGQDMSNAALDELYQRMPENARGAMDLARRAARGERIDDASLQMAMDVVRPRGEAAVNRLIAEAGFQASLDGLDPNLRIGLQTGLIVGKAEAHKYIGPLWSTTEDNPATLDEHAARGRQIMATGVEWFGRRIEDIRAGRSLTFTRKIVDPFTNVLRPQTMRYEIGDQWRRGFDVGFGLCEGKAEDDQEQQTVKGWLAHPYAYQGFDVAQAMQHYRTSSVIRGRGDEDVWRHTEPAPEHDPNAIQGTADQDVLRFGQRRGPLDPGGILPISREREPESFLYRTKRFR
jgi:hypothetical protein